MSHCKLRSGTYRIGALALALVAPHLQLALGAQTSDPGSAPAAAPMPTQPYVLPPTDERPTSPAATPTSPPKAAPHAIVLPPPPDAANEAPKAVKAVKPPATAASKPVVTPTNPPPAPPTSPVAEQPAQAVQPVPAPTPAVAAPPTDQGAGTFGFYAGETRDQILAAVGKDNVLKQQGDILEVAAAPKPDPTFDSFLLVVGNDTGLVKLIATGKDIEDDAAGRAMKAQFTSIKGDLSKGYGDPSDNFDFLDAKATHRSPNQFMLSLTNSERTLAAYWTKKDFGNGINSISLSGNGLGDDTGYLSVEYEFAGYHAYLSAKK